MSDTALADQPAGSSPKISTIHEAVIRIARDSQDATQAICGPGREKGRNVSSLGLVARMVSLNVPKLEKLIQERFAGKDPTIAETALACFRAGHGHEVQGLYQTFAFQPGANVGHQQVV